MTEPREVKVVDRFGCLVQVSLPGLEQMLQHDSAVIDVHHINAVGAFAPPGFEPLLLRALTSGDHILVRAVARVAVRLRLHSLVPYLETAATLYAEHLTQAALLAAIEYLKAPDHGLSTILSHDPLCVHLVANLLLIRSFHRADLTLAMSVLAHFTHILEHQPRAMSRRVVVESILPNAINGLLGCLSQPELAQSLSSEERLKLLASIDRLQSSSAYSYLEEDACEELLEVRGLVPPTNAGMAGGHPCC